jgi:long-chain acyl-CoA synthetase
MCSASRRSPPKADTLAGKHWAWRWWKYRKVHKLFGWKFWCVVCGAAPLDPELEAFWRKLGFLVVQGYGITETAPIVTLNHPAALVEWQRRTADSRSGDQDRP